MYLDFSQHFLILARKNVVTFPVNWLDLFVVLDSGLGSINFFERVSMKSSITSALLVSALMIASQSALAQTAPAGAGAAGGGALGGVATSTIVVGALVAASVLAIASDNSATAATATK